MGPCTGSQNGHTTAVKIYFSDMGLISQFYFCSPSYCTWTGSYMSMFVIVVYTIQEFVHVFGGL